MYNHAPGADFADLVDAPVRILVGSEDDYEGGPNTCQILLRSLAPADAAHVSVRVLTGATHLFDSFGGSYEYNDPASHRRQGGMVRVLANPEARREARDDLVQFFSATLRQR